MVQKNPFLKYLIKDKKEDVFHSSAYAKAQNGASIGAATSESYQVRVNINQNRQRVKGYKDSEIMMGASGGMRKAEAYKPLTDMGARGGVSGVGNTIGASTGGASAGIASAGGAVSKPPMMPKNPGISIKR